MCGISSVLPAFPSISNEQQFRDCAQYWYTARIGRKGGQDDEVVAALVGALAMAALVRTVWQTYGAGKCLTTR